MSDAELDGPDFAGGYAALRRWAETTGTPTTDEFRELYFKKVGWALSEMPAKVKKLGVGVRKTLRVPKWNGWMAYEKRDFDETYGWMVESGIAPSGHASEEVVAANSKEIFG